MANQRESIRRHGEMVSESSSRRENRSEINGAESGTGSHRRNEMKENL
jgi:hypothetical protein